MMDMMAKAACKEYVVAKIDDLLLDDGYEFCHSSQDYIHSKHVLVRITRYVVKSGNSTFIG